MVNIRGQDYAEYLKGDSWRCSNSPTGAHYWIVGNQTVCKHCLMVKQSQTVRSVRDIVIHPAKSNLKAELSLFGGDGSGDGGA